MDTISEVMNDILVFQGLLLAIAFFLFMLQIRKKKP